MPNPIKTSFDCDGVIFVKDECIIRPGENAIIITGRSYQETDYTLDWLRRHKIFNPVYFSPAQYEHKTREISGAHKARTIMKYGIEVHFEDDEIQAGIINDICENHNYPIDVVLINAPALSVNLENEAHGELSS